jgi:hypothetical protein
LAAFQDTGGVTDAVAAADAFESARGAWNGPDFESTSHDQTTNLTEGTQVDLADGIYAIASDCSH